MVRKYSVAVAGSAFEARTLRWCATRVSVMSVSGLEPHMNAGNRRWRGAVSLGASGVGACRLRSSSGPPRVLFPRPRTFLSGQIRPRQPEGCRRRRSPCLTAEGNIWSATLTRSPAADITPPRTPPIRRSAWPPGMARRSMAAAPPTAKSTTWPRCQPPIRRCRCRAMLA